MMAATTDRIAIAPAERRAAVLDTIAGARSRLILSLFRCDDFGVLDALAAALSRGVSVHVLITNRSKGGHKRLAEICMVLADSGATLHRYPDPVAKYHAKYIAADRRVALIGSANWTRKCLGKTCDFILTTTDRDVVEGVESLFAADCLARPVVSRASHGRLIIGPEHARNRLAALLRTATHRIDIVDPKLDDPAMRGLLAERRAAGVHVNWHGRDGLAGMSAHGKLIVVDGRVAALGSLSLSAIHLGFRRELAIMSDDARVLRSLNRILEADGPPTHSRAPCARTPQHGDV